MGGTQGGSQGCVYCPGDVLKKQLQVDMSDLLARTAELSHRPTFKGDPHDSRQLIDLRRQVKHLLDIQTQRKLRVVPVANKFYKQGNTSGWLLASVFG